MSARETTLYKKRIAAKDVRALIKHPDSIPAVHRVTPKNFYVIAGDGTKLSIKSIIYALTRGMSHHADDAVRVLMDLGVRVHARRHKVRYDHVPLFQKKGLFVIDSDETDEQPAVEHPVEGTEGQRIVTYGARYERKRRLRDAALKLHGCSCQVCGFNFETAYGKIGKGYAEVHHLKPLGTQQKEQPVNPKRDMAVLCANCHRMVHKRNGQCFSVRELKALVEGAKARQRRSQTPKRNKQRRSV